MIPGQRRKYSDGVTLIQHSSGLKIVLYKDCIVITALNHMGIITLNFPGVVNHFLKDQPNVKLYKDAIGEIHCIEIYYEEKFK